MPLALEGCCDGYGRALLSRETCLLMMIGLVVPPLGAGAPVISPSVWLPLPRLHWWDALLRKMDFTADDSDHAEGPIARAIFQAVA